MDQQLIDWLEQNNIPFITVCTKADKLTNNKMRTQLARNHKALAGSKVEKILPFSAVTKTGKEELLNEIATYI
jgi:GTP-binding protein